MNQWFAKSGFQRSLLDLWCYRYIDEHDVDGSAIVGDYKGKRKHNTHSINAGDIKFQKKCVKGKN